LFVVGFGGASPCGPATPMGVRKVSLRGWRVHCLLCMRPSARGAKLLACPTPPCWSPGRADLLDRSAAFYSERTADLQIRSALPAFRPQSYRPTLRYPATTVVLEYDTLRLVPALSVPLPAQASAASLLASRRLCPETSGAGLCGSPVLRLPLRTSALHTIPSGRESRAAC